MTGRSCSSRPATATAAAGSSELQAQLGSELRTGLGFLTVNDPLVAWLVYRGEMVSAPRAHERAISFWTAGYLAGQSDSVRAARFDQEVALERVRQQAYPHAVSRLTGFYLFPDSASAARASQEWSGFSAEFRAEVGLRPDVRVSQHDAQWISNELDSGSDAWMPSYLAGEPYNEAPIWELLVDGRALVYGTELRQAAYEVVKRAWPESLGLLELARLGVELGSDLGLIIGMVFKDGPQRRLRYVMNFEDATNVAFLERLKTFEGPKNTADLHLGAELVVPDLTSREFSV